jgi:hypothetical protein
VVAAFVGAAVVFVAGDFAGAKLLKTRRERAEVAMLRYLAAPESASPMFVVEDVLSPAERLEEEKAREELSEAIGLGIYEPPQWMVVEAGAKGKLAEARPEWFAAPAVGADGRRVYPAEALAGAYRATAVWGTILLSDASYVSPFYDAAKRDPCGGAMTPYATPRKFVGVGRPVVDDERQPQRLVGGSVILGEVCGGASMQAAHVGVDAGAVVARTVYGGVRSNGIFLFNEWGFNPKRGTRLEDVSVLTNDADGQHSVLIEGEEGAVVDGLWIWTPGGTHGLILKSAHSVVRNFHCRGGTADCLLVKSDYRTAESGSATDDRFENIDIADMEKPGDTGGISFDAHWDDISNMVFRDVREEGLSFGFEGGGSWFYELKGLSVDGWSARGMVGPCANFERSAGVEMEHFECEETAAGGTGAFLIRGRQTTLRDGLIGCGDAVAACAAAGMDGVVDDGRETTLSRLSGEKLGGYLVAMMTSARGASYTERRVMGMGDRVQTVRRPQGKTLRVQVKEFWGELKPQVRIVWQTTITWGRRAWRWMTQARG